MAAQDRAGLALGVEAGVGAVVELGVAVGESVGVAAVVGFIVCGGGVDADGAMDGVDEAQPAIASTRTIRSA